MDTSASLDSRFQLNSNSPLAYDLVFAEWGMRSISVNYNQAAIARLAMDPATVAIAMLMLNQHQPRERVNWKKEGF